MGSLYRRSDKSHHLLLPTTIIGRAEDATIRSDPGNTAVSRQQFLIRWEYEGWKIQLLSHRSSTWLNGRRLKHTDLILLQADDRLAMGDPEVDLVVHNVEPPELGAAHRGSGERRLSGAQGLQLPGLILRQTPEEGWQIERPESVEKLDLSSLQSPEECIRLGEWDIGIANFGLITKVHSPSLEQLHLVLLPLHNLESVRLILRSDNWEVDLGHRAEFYPLFILAQARLKGPNGWLETEVLTKQVRDYSWPTVEAYLSRIGSLLTKTGVSDGRSLIESAHKMRRIRLDPSQIHIQPES